MRQINILSILNKNKKVHFNTVFLLIELQWTPELYALFTIHLPFISGLVRFMGYGDLWGFKLTVLIFYKSRAGIYGDLYHPHAFHKSP